MSQRLSSLLRRLGGSPTPDPSNTDAPTDAPESLDSDSASSENSRRGSLLIAVVAIAILAASVWNATSSLSPSGEPSGPLAWANSTFDWLRGQSGQPALAGRWRGSLRTTNQDADDGLPIELEIFRDGNMQIVRWGSQPTTERGNAGYWIITAAHGSTAVVKHPLDPDFLQETSASGSLTLDSEDQLEFTPPLQDHLRQFLERQFAAWSDSLDDEPLVASLERLHEPVADQARTPNSPDSQRLVGIWRQHALPHVLVQSKVEFADDGTFEFREESPVRVESVEDDEFGQSRAVPFQSHRRRRGRWSASPAGPNRLNIVLVEEGQSEPQQMVASLQGEDYMSLRTPEQRGSPPWERVPTIVK